MSTHPSRLGENGFQSNAAAGAFTALVILTNEFPSPYHALTGIDASTPKTVGGKAFVLRNSILETSEQLLQLDNPDSRITLQQLKKETFLDEFAVCIQGLATSDDPQFVQFFWEQPTINRGWEPLLGTVKNTTAYGGRERIFFWENGKGRYFQHAMKLKEVGRLGGWKSGTEARGKLGVIVSQMRALPVSLYLGEFYNHNASVILPNDSTHLQAIWEFCKSVNFNFLVREIDQSLKPSNNTLVKIPFDLDHWQQVADEAGPLPEPYSNDPTQWLFQGHPVDSTAQLQVAVARLLDYHWPQQDVPDEMDHLADKDGIVCLPPLAGEPPAHERLRQVLAAAYAHFWMTSVHDKLLQDVGYGGQTLEAWLRDGFFEQHCKLFQNRPFIWHIWDGRKDGFAALVNYHKLDATRLNNLIYTYLGDWIRLQRADQDAGVPGADGRLVAALELQKKLIAIQHGEPPYDIYVRWKPLHEQPIGWHPDLNDGVRLNIRPFVEAGILRRKFNINWSKDRGQNPDGTERLNDLHYTRAEKEAARRAKGQNTQ